MKITQERVDEIRAMEFPDMTEGEAELTRIGMIHTEMGIAFKSLSPEGQPYKIGDLVTDQTQRISAKIGAVHGYYEDEHGLVRVAIGAGFGVCLGNTAAADARETLAYNLYSDNFLPVERRMTCLLYK